MSAAGASFTSPFEPTSRSLQRTKTLDARHPLSEQSACCRIVMELDLEYATYQEALEFHLEGKDLDTLQIGYCIANLASLIFKTKPESDKARVRSSPSEPAEAESSAVSDQNVSRVQRAIKWAAQNDSATQFDSASGKLRAYFGLAPETEDGKEDQLYFLRILLEDLVLLRGIHVLGSAATEYNPWATERLRALKAANRTQSAPTEGLTLPDQRTAINRGGQGKVATTGEVFIIVGLLYGELNDPAEVCIRIGSDQRKNFLPILKERIRILRGWRSIFSFKAVSGFGLYKCIPLERAHAPYETSPAEKAMLRQFYRATMESSRAGSPFSKPTASKDWAAYVHQNLNKSQAHPSCAELSLQLQLRWSKLRLPLAASSTLFLSFVAGMLYTFLRGGDDDAVSAAWTIASYIVTSGAFIIALGAVLSGFKD